VPLSFIYLEFLEPELQSFGLGEKWSWDGGNWRPCNSYDFVNHFNTIFLAMLTSSSLSTKINYTIRAVARHDNWGEGVYIHIFMSTYRKNNRFQKKSVRQNTNIWIYPPPPPQIIVLATALYTIRKIAKMYVYISHLSE
jgi:hypothetical protein